MYIWKCMQDKKKTMYIMCNAIQSVYKVQFINVKCNVQIKKIWCNTQFINVKCNVQFKNVKCNVKFLNTKYNAQFKNAKYNTKFINVKCNVKIINAMCNSKYTAQHDVQRIHCTVRSWLRMPRKYISKQDGVGSERLHRGRHD